MVPQKQPNSEDRSATLTIPELQQSKTAVLNTLRAMRMPSKGSSLGIAVNLD